MDLFSHALLPYFFGTLLKRKKEEVTAFVIGGIAPDFDIILLIVNYLFPTSFLITHRGITHSIIFGFITAIFVLFLASRERIKEKVRKYINFEPVVNLNTVAFAGAGMLIHLFLDYLTSRGVPFLFPIANTRYSAEIFFYTDIILSIASLAIVIYLLKKPLKKHTVLKISLLFLLLFSVLGILRIEEKTQAENYFNDNDIRTFSTMSPFDWYVQGANASNIKVYEYNSLDRDVNYNITVPRFTMLSEGENMENMLKAADELPQVKMFKWRAYSVAVNASNENGTWRFEYFDPVQDAMGRDAPGIISRGMGGHLNVTVVEGKASIN
jgi:inner membrane protein